jgi:soluble lytic murein transglycosylase-like protein
MCIIGRESGGEPEADDPRSTASGLFQILGSLWAPHYGVSTTDLYDPETNVRLAADIWRQSGWWAWSPYVRGSCR